MSNRSSKEHLFSCKAIYLGNSGVGKTQLILAVCDGAESQVIPNQAALPVAGSTVGVDFRVVTRPVGNNCVARLMLWDTAGQERFANIMPSYVRESEIMFLVYDVTDASSFGAIETRWMPVAAAHRQAIKEATNADGLIFFLIANKVDLVDRRVISNKQGVEFALKHQLIYMETTALVRKTAHDIVGEAATRIASVYTRNGSMKDRMCDDKYKRYTNTVSLPSTNAAREKSSCCSK
jgi:Ras-related protein Rab-6A